MRRLAWTAVIVLMSLGASWEHEAASERTKGEFIATSNETLAGFQGLLNAGDRDGVKPVLNDSQLKMLETIWVKYRDFEQVLGDGCCYLAYDVKAIADQSHANEVFNDEHDPAKLDTKRAVSEEVTLRLGYRYYLFAAKCQEGGHDFTESELKSIGVELKKFGENSLFEKEARDKFWSDAQKVANQGGITLLDCLKARKFLLAQFPAGFENTPNPF